MFGDSDMYASFPNPHSNPGQSFQVPVDSSSSPSPSFHMPTNSSSSMHNMPMPTSSQPQLEIPSVFSQQLYHAQFSPHMNISIAGGGLGSLQEAVLMPQQGQQVMSPQCPPQQSFSMNETVNNSAYGSQNCANPSPFSPQECPPNPNPGVKGTEVVGIGGEEEEVKKNSKESGQKKRAKNWGRSEMSKLARLRHEREGRFEKGAKKAELWEEIAEALRVDGICRDSHQCRDKWEKIMGGDKNWNKDGGKGREDNSFFEELHELFGGRTLKREMEQVSEPVLEDGTEERFLRESQFVDEEETDVDMAALAGRKRKRARTSYMPVSDISVVRDLIVTVMDSYHRKVKEVLEVLDRREQAREQVRLEKEEKWRAEDFAQREAFNKAMLSIVQTLANDHPRNVVAASGAVAAQAPQSKKRSRNWKAHEVRELIKLRGEMDGRFAEVARSRPLWEELSDQLAVKGIDRDPKQCKEKWDKLLADYKEVLEEKKEAASSPFFPEMQAIQRRHNIYPENAKPENSRMENVHPENNDIMKNAHPDSVTRENAFVMDNAHPDSVTRENAFVMDNVRPDSVTRENTFVENVNPQ